MSGFARHAHDTGGTSAHDTSNDGERAAEHNAEEPTPNLSDGDTDENHGDSPRRGGEGEDHTVPLKTLLSEREKRRQAEDRMRELEEFYNNNRETVESYQNAKPKIRKLVDDHAALGTEYETLMERYKALKAAAQEHDLDFDDEAAVRERSMVEALNQLRNVPDMVRDTVRTTLEEEQREREEAAARRQAESQYEEARRAFYSRLDEAERQSGVIAARRESIEAAFERSRGALTAEVLIDPILDSVKEVAKTAKGREQAKGITSARPTGNVAPVDTGDNENPLDPLPGETIESYFNRIGRKARA